ncbi:MAG: hypothetical protein ACRBN8_18430 [Nannocystales bacterium]
MGYEDLDCSARSGQFSLGAADEVYAFSSEALETPESVAVGYDGTLFVSLALTGEIAAIDESGQRTTVAVLPLGDPADCQGPFGGIMGALAVDWFNNLYVPVNSCDPASRGIWKVAADGAATLVASLPADALGNGIALWGPNLYVADTAAPRVFKAPVQGTGAAASVWAETPLLADTNPLDLVPAANGIQAFKGELYVANSAEGTIVAIPMLPPYPWKTNPVAGVPYVKYGDASKNPVFAYDEPFPGCDDFALDFIGTIYCTTDPFQTVVSISKYGEVETILDASDGLDGPTAAAFGRGLDAKTLYISNAAFPFFPGTGNGPSLMSIQTPLFGYWGR